MNGAHPPPYRHSGSEPENARTPLHMRRTAARMALPVFGLGCALFAWLAVVDAGGGRVLWIVLAGVCAVSVPIALMDLRRVGHRLRIQEHAWKADDSRDRTRRRT